jgi:prephenate dehydrogenase
MSKPQKNHKIAIIGGIGEFGRLFARFFAEDGHKVVVTGRNAEKGEKVAASLGVDFTVDNKGAAEKSDIVIISVPIEDTVDVISEVAPHVRSGKLLMDFTSVKIEPTKAMEEKASKEVEIMGSHPMFGPRVESLEGQIVILTPIRGKKWTPFLKDFFSDHKARVSISTPEEHDRIMAVVQGLTHFAYITTASAIRRLEINVEESRKFASPVYELMLDFIARIVGQNPRLYASIQMHNPFVKEVHEVFIKEAEKLKNDVSMNDVQGFVKTMSKSSRIFKDVDSSMGKSDKAISALTQELKKLKKSVGKEVALKHIYSSKTHIGIVVSVDPEEVVIRKRGKNVSLKLSNIELLDDKSTLELKREQFGTKKMDFSYVFPSDVDEKILAEVVEKFRDSILSCEVIDVFQGGPIPAGKKSITLRSEGFNLKGMSPLEGLLTSLGGKAR